MSATGGGFLKPDSLQDTVCQMAFPVKARPNVTYYGTQGGGSLASIPARGSPFTRSAALTTGLVIAESATTGGNIDNFSARVLGFIRPTVSGNYIFHISSDDGGFFTIGSANGSLCALTITPTISNAGYSGAQGTGGAVSGAITLTAGVAYPFEAGFSEGSGGDYIQVDWSGAAGARQLIPIAVLFEQNPNRITRRQITRITSSEGAVTYRDPIDGLPVTPSATESLVSCQIDACSQSVLAVPNYASILAANADAALLTGSQYTVTIGGGKQLYIK